jgi:uncharacterized protein (TIGR01777 family)
MKILIGGASGLVGTSLSSYLESKGHEVYTLVRNTKNLNEHAILWDPENEIITSPEKCENMDAVINLSGDNIASGRWNDEKKTKILSSRIKATATICKMLVSLKHPPKVLVNASAIGFYGDRKDEVLTEESHAGINFLAGVCLEWEAATNVLKDSGIRVVLLRTGAVISNEGGMLPKLLIPFKFGLGGKIGTGNQFLSYVDLSDLDRIILFAIENDKIFGPLNAVSPHPVTNEQFTKTLGTLLNRPTFFNVPAFAARLGFGEMADELVLASQKVLPKKLLEAGFVFNYPTIETTLSHNISS